MTHSSTCTTIATARCARRLKMAVRETSEFMGGEEASRPLYDPLRPKRAARVVMTARSGRVDNFFLAFTC